MIKTLTPHGNSAALIIDKALLEILRIDLNTPLEIVTDGRSLIITPAVDEPSEDRLAAALSVVNSRHGKTLKRLAG
ncbi:MAG: AbrB/MazE/SpoVT family DNA-binding domain-containing protein [Chloroflexi bacterium]|nr:AbrB/MazE/SpoVT family DNA-binding domain-containing protein [Chloroflexota bacterium]